MTPYELAKTQIGISEIPGEADEPQVIQYFADVGYSWVKADETAWCAAFVGAMLERCGIESTRALNARSYMDFGDPVPIGEQRMGDIAVFWRGTADGWQGHVGFYVRDRGPQTFDILGGNQGNKVSVAPYARNRLLGFRRIPGQNVTSLAKPSIFAAILNFLKQIGLVK